MGIPSRLRPTARFVTKMEEELVAAADILVVSLVMRAGVPYVRLRVHRRVPSAAGVRTVGGTRGLVLPVGVAAAVANLLTQAVGQVLRKRWG